jgi:hypothetical protein
MSDNYTPAYCNLANALRDFEQAHRVWMNTCVFTPEGERAKAEKNRTMAIYAQARNVWEKEQYAPVEECH